MKHTDPKIEELIEAAENAVYWMLRAHASNIEEGICDRTCPPPAYAKRLQDATKQFRAKPTHPKS
jgi:hypothetical protein